MPQSTMHKPTPCAVPGFLTDLIISDRQTGQPSVPAESEEPAREWLVEILLEVDALNAHLDKLKVGYEARFRRPRPHWERPRGERIVHDPSSGFRWFDLLPEDKIQELLVHGPSASVLDPGELARLLLNPFGLCDLAERIDVDLPEWWLHAMDVRGKARLKEQGIRLRLPVIATGDGAFSSELASVGVRSSRVDLDRHTGNCWELKFGDDMEAVGLGRAYAGKLYGDPEKAFTLRLYAHAPETADAPVPFSLEVEPAPTHGPATVQLEFPGAEVRSFLLEPPETFPGVDAPASFRSARCAPVPAERVKFTTITWGEDPDNRHLLRGWQTLTHRFPCAVQIVS